MTQPAVDHAMPLRTSTELPALDEDTLRQIGQMIMVVFDGFAVTPEIQALIEKYYVGSILLTSRNIRDGIQVATLSQRLQTIAQSAGYHKPLIIGIEQENGMVGSTLCTGEHLTSVKNLWYDRTRRHGNVVQISRLGDGIRATHFPGPMAIGATRSPGQAFEIAKATARELAAVGINWNFAPVLDVIGEQGSTGISVRAFGDDPQLVGRYGVAFAEGLGAGGLIHCAKHFPGIGSIRGSRRASVFTSKSRDELESTELAPFRRAVAMGLDSVMLSSTIWPGNAPDDATNAQQAKHIIHEVLRRQLGYDGVTICDVTDMPAYVNEGNIGDAIVMALGAGCDMIRIYQSHSTQLKGLEAIYQGLADGLILRSQIQRATGRIKQLKEHYLSWQKALAAPDPQRLPSLMQDHASIARKATESSITVVRDHRTMIPLSSKVGRHGVVLLLTPVVRPLHPRTPGEPTRDPFETLGRALARLHPKIVHAPYTNHGMTPTHVNLLKGSSGVIFVTANATHPKSGSQVQTANAVHRLVHHKPLVNLAVCDPYDLLDDKKFGTYVCTYEYTPMALEAAAAVIFGERHASGVLPVNAPGAPAARQQRVWFVEVWDKKRDLYSSADLWRDCLGRKWPLDAGTLSALLDRPGYAKHFVVRHPTTQELLGLCATYTTILDANKSIGSLALLLVRPTHRDLGIGLSLHDVAVRHLNKVPGISSMQLGSIFPRLFPGLPVDLPADDTAWFEHRGWKKSENYIYDLLLQIDQFSITNTKEVHEEMEARGITINNCREEQFDQLLNFEEAHFGAYPGWVEKYRALGDTDDIADAIIAYDSREILGAVLIFTPVGNNQISKDIPWPRIIGDRVGGLGFVGVKPVSPSEGQGIRKGLIIAAILELKKRGLRGCFIDWADDIDTYMSLGFREWGKYREIWRKI